MDVNPETLQELGQFKERCQEKAEITADPNNATVIRVFLHLSSHNLSSTIGDSCH